MMEPLYAVAWGSFGGLAIQVLPLMEMRNVKKSQRPDFRDFFYWLPFLLGPILGAGLALLYAVSRDHLDAGLAFNVGVSAPLILKAMATANPFDQGGIDVDDDA